MKKKLIEYGIFGVVILTLFLTGLHTEVFGFIQRGLLQTGLMNPKVEQESQTDPSKNPEADFNLHLINSQGDKVSLEKFRGKVIFINLWATWCPPCIAEMPGINSLYNKIKDQNVEFIMLSLDENFEKAKKFKARKEFDFEVYKLDGPIPQMYYTQSIPTTFIIDSQGGLALTHMGMADYDTEEFREFLGQLK